MGFVATTLTELRLHRLELKRGRTASRRCGRSALNGWATVPGTRVVDVGEHGSSPLLISSSLSARTGVASGAQGDPYTGGRVEMVNIVAKLPEGRGRGAQSDARRRLATGIGALFGAFTVGAIAEYFVFDR